MLGVGFLQQAVIRTKKTKLTLSSLGRVLISLQLTVTVLAVARALLVGFVF